MVIIKFNEIKNKNELADFLKIPRQVMTYILYIKKVDNLYTSFEIPKKNGGVRVINAPVSSLKDIQKKLSEALWEYQKDIRIINSVNSNISHAFEKEKSIITNAYIHKNKRFVFNIDLKDFFTSFHFGRVRGFFQKNKHFQLPIELATVIAQLTCYEGCLPQGAPTSPIITNLICNILDFKLLNISKKYKLDYTRYADDLTFSTNNKHFIRDIDAFFLELDKQINKSGFQIKENKTRLQFRDSRQVVTGLVVNKKININKDFYKKTRAMAHNLYSKNSFEIDGNIGTINQLEGRFNFINQIDWYNNKKNKEKSNFHHLNAREKEYQKFLFYKYFYANNKPLIITEGKTDRKYLQAALKKLYSDYPNLITKENNYFSFNVSFLKRTKRLKYFFNLHLDGADTLTNIYNLYGGGNNLTNYWKYFNKICNHSPTNPVILIFDNELTSQGKPIKKFLDFVNKDKKNTINIKKENLQENLHQKVIGNLFILTNSLVDDLLESEIEDLFDPNTLAHKIHEKTFSRNTKDSNKNYGKEVFSNYVLNNYYNINFNNFRPMLTSMNTLVVKFNAEPE